MLYKDGNTLALDGSPIKPNALRAVRNYQKGAIKNLTEAEQAFVRAVSPLYPRTKVTYVKQVIFYVTDGVSFRADFVFRKYHLIVELDGASHSTTGEKDAWRDRVLLETRGYKTLRLPNELVLRKPLTTRVRVLQALSESPHGFKRLVRPYLAEMLMHPGYLREQAEP